MKKIFAFISLSLLIFIASCNKPNPFVPDQTKTVVLPAAGDAIINANNKFAFNSCFCWRPRRQWLAK